MPDLVAAVESIGETDADCAKAKPYLEAFSRDRQRRLAQGRRAALARRRRAEVSAPEELLAQEAELSSTRFDNDTALALGQALVAAAREDGLAVTVDVRRGEQQLFHAALAGTAADNDAWIERKNRVVRRFGHSSLYVGLLLGEGTTIEEKFLLDDTQYAAHGGAFPVIVRDVGMVGTVTVSGLPQAEDHRLVVAVLRGFLGLPGASEPRVGSGRPGHVVVLHLSERRRRGRRARGVLRGPQRARVGPAARRHARRGASGPARSCCRRAPPTARCTCSPTAGSSSCARARAACSPRSRRRPASARRPSSTASPRGVAVRAVTHGELERLSWEAFEGAERARPAARARRAGRRGPGARRPRPGGRRQPRRLSWPPPPSPTTRRSPRGSRSARGGACGSRSLVAALVVAGLLIVSPDDGLFVMWKLVIPLLPLLFLVAPGVWRNLCPLAASNQTPRVLGLTRGLTAPAWFKEYGYVVAISLFVLFVVLRKLGLDDSGPASALLLLGALTGGFLGGMYLKGKSGWCSSICPLLPVQRIYGQTPFALVGNSHCQPCVGCTTNCYDFNPKAAYLADLQQPRTRTGRATGSSSSPPSPASCSRSSRCRRRPTRSACRRCSGGSRSTWRRASRRSCCSTRS